MKELLIAMYRIRPCHKMIPLSVKIRTRAVSSCGPGAALSTLVTTFSLQPSGLTSNQRVLLSYRTRDALSTSNQSGPFVVYDGQSGQIKYSYVTSLLLRSCAWRLNLLVISRVT